MQIAQEIKRVLSKNPGKIKLQKFLLRFSKKKKLSHQEQGELNKSYIRSMIRKK
jgi:hypothetical protein